MSARRNLSDFTPDQARFIRRRGEELGEAICRGERIPVVKCGVCPVCGQAFTSPQNAATCGNAICMATARWARSYANNRKNSPDRNGAERISYAWGKVPENLFTVRSGDGYFYNADPLLGF